MKRFLTMKHWQLFLLLIVPPFVLQMVLFTSIIASGDPMHSLALFPVIMVIFMGVFFAWFYSLGTNLHKKLPGGVPMNVARFKLFLAIPFCYIAVLCIGMFWVFSNFGKIGQPQPPLGIIAIMLPLYLFSMFCIFYCLVFIAKCLKTVELQRPVTFSDYAGEFFLIWFFIIGIWIIQPRINKIFSDEYVGHNNFDSI